MMRIFLLGSSGFHTRVGSPSTRAAVGIGPVFVMSLGSVAGAVFAAGAGVSVGGGVASDTTGGMIVGAAGSGAGAVGVVEVGATGSGIGAAGCSFFGAGAGSVPVMGFTGAGVAAVVAADVGAEMNPDGVGAASQLVVCTGSSCGGSTAVTGRG